MTDSKRQRNRSLVASDVVSIAPRRHTLRELAMLAAAANGGRITVGELGRYLADKHESARGNKLCDKGDSDGRIAVQRMLRVGFVQLADEPAAEPEPQPEPQPEPAQPTQQTRPQPGPYWV